MHLLDTQSDGSFGKFFGHPKGEAKSKEFVIRMLAEFNFDFSTFRNILAPIPIPADGKVTALQEPIKEAFVDKGWNPFPKYPESNYTADLRFNIGERYIFVEVELSDVRRAVNAFFMSRVFRTGFMRLGIFITPESNRPEPKLFYSSLVRRYDYLAPEYPLWVMGFSYP